MATLSRDPSAPGTVFPPADGASLGPLHDDLASSDGRAALVGPDGTRVEIPGQIHDALIQVVDALRRGSAVTVAPISTRLTTSQAAELLGVSRPTLVRLIEAGSIPYDQPRRHRFLRLDDVLAFKERRQHEQRMRLAEMTRQAVADGLYQDTAEDYADALREARGKTA
ncbi:MAG: helix-turn-helix domain-containing protein [Bifidobacteriaceae bacterium]|jgi:excisionase family DNA binding protein|nr:helix-turn-helix domain-containing protein [Bifidobacteriaceae bacterium]